MKISDFDGIGMVEESGVASNLNHASLSHSLVDDDVEDLAHSQALGPVGVVDVSGVDNVLALVVDDQHDLLSLELGVDEKGFAELLLRPQVEAGVDVLTHQHFNPFLLAIDDLVHLELGALVLALGIINVISDPEWVLEHLWSILADFHPKLVCSDTDCLRPSVSGTWRHGHE